MVFFKIHIDEFEIFKVVIQSLSLVKQTLRNKKVKEKAWLDQVVNDLLLVFITYELLYIH